jgi:serine/threonine protein phosphatase PrpC
MTVHVWCQTDVGLRREHNEDSFLYDESTGLYMVADGMGGHRGGEVASKMAVESMRDFIRKAVADGGRRLNPRLMLVEGYEDASRRIYDHSQDPAVALEGMGTTLVSAFIKGQTLYVANVGDSRAYLYSHGQLWQLTEDHSYVYEQLRAGLINENDLSIIGRNVITRSVGYEREVQVDVIERQLQPGEMVLICSDGLSSLVPDKRIAEIFKSTQPAEIVPICITEAKKNGGDDNVTVMLLYAEPRSN